MSVAEFRCLTSEENGCFIVRPAGYLDEVGGKALRGFFDPPARKGIKKFVLNLQGTPVINSQGITQILEIVETLLYDHKAALAIVGLSDLYVDVFQVVGILKLVKTFPDEVSAVKGL